MLVKWGLIRFYEAPWGACKKEFTYLVVEFWVGFKKSLCRDYIFSFNKAQSR